MLGMSAGEERSASGGGGWTNLATVFVPVVVVVLHWAGSNVKLFGI